MMVKVMSQLLCSAKRRTFQSVRKKAKAPETKSSFCLYMTHSLLLWHMGFLQCHCLWDLQHMQALHRYPLPFCNVFLSAVCQQGEPSLRTELSVIAFCHWLALMVRILAPARESSDSCFYPTLSVWPHSSTQRVGKRCQFCG